MFRAILSLTNTTPHILNKKISKSRSKKDNAAVMAGGGTGSFRYTVWDPLMIIAQIATLQSLYYVSLGLWIFIFDILQGLPRSLDQIFTYQVINL